MRGGYSSSQLVYDGSDGVTLVAGNSLVVEEYALLHSSSALAFWLQAVRQRQFQSVVRWVY